MSRSPVIREHDIKTVVCVTPVQLPDRYLSSVVGDRILEGLCEGVVRVNQELMMAGVLPKLHPYDDQWEMEYERDPRSLGTLRIDGRDMEAREYWATAYGAAMRKQDDCETLSSWLAAWYRVVCKVNAAAAIYPTVKGPNGIVGRHVVVWVPMRRPLYRNAPWMSNRFIRYEIPGQGYIEDPSVALGMFYKTDPRGRQPMPPRTPFKLDNHDAAGLAKHLEVPYLPSHFVTPPESS